ncbi:granulins isoform X3 [Notechis scutatus]|uniref:Granulins isoform X3 n=1 Tax=Notechis scutatus TaxID=8663 RepID=A0A6J1VFV1_9SAUR|nr:granulins isoform X3 [Notechis scutatus]
MARMWVHFIVFLVLSTTASSLKCPDGQKCEGSSICCKLPEGDKYTCCGQPQFTGASLRMLPPESRNEVSGVVCPDASTCPVTHSCQLSLNSTFACCPWEEATSCVDGHHCCPLGTHCSTDGRVCIENEGIWRQNSTSAVIVRAVQCPDSEWECPDGSTCCLMADESWGCCPMPEASCCADKIHCCPHGTTCDLVEARCLETFGEQPLSKKFPAKKRTPVLNLTQKKICPGNHSSCPDAATCCLLPTGQYGCCPLQNAVCCSDHLHCCPQGTQCDLKQSKCTMTPKESWPITHLSAGFHTAHDIQCDSEFTCPDGNTCCKTTSGSWGCCPMEEATCCQDQIHCCPSGYNCDSSSGTCLKDGDRMPWVEKTTAIVGNLPSSRDVKCDDQYSCPDGQTCCLRSGAWACCPLFQATCCEDHQHCCPFGYTCNVAAQSCEKQHRPGLADAAGDLLTSLQNAVSNQDVLCGEQHYCHVGQTCCKAKSGSWACCPYEKGTCCHDRRHCCPSGFYCSRFGYHCYRKSSRWDTGSVSPHSIDAHVLL